MHELDESWCKPRPLLVEDIEVAAAIKLRGKSPKLAAPRSQEQTLGRSHRLTELRHGLSRSSSNVRGPDERGSRRSRPTGTAGCVRATARLQNREHPESQSDQGNESTADNLAVTFEGPKLDALQAGRRIYAEQDISQDGARSKDDRHDEDKTQPVLSGREECGDAFDHRRRAKNQQ